MSAYVISDVEIPDQTLIGEYRVLAQDSIARYGAAIWRVAARSRQSKAGGIPRVSFIVELPDMGRAGAWYSSPEYATALKVRWRALDRRLIFVDGARAANAVEGS